MFFSSPSHIVEELFIITLDLFSSPAPSSCWTAWMSRNWISLVNGYFNSLPPHSAPPPRRPAPGFRMVMVTDAATDILIATLAFAPMFPTPVCCPWTSSWCVCAETDSVCTFLGVCVNHPLSVLLGFLR